MVQALRLLIVVQKFQNTCLYELVNVLKCFFLSLRPEFLSFFEVGMKNAFFALQQQQGGQMGHDITQNFEKF